MKMLKGLILKISDKKRYLFPLVLLLVFMPLFVEGAIFTGIFDFFTAVLEGISETAIPFKLFFVFLLIALILSNLFLSLSVSLLEIAANPARVEIMESEMVQIGWQFTSSLANTGIIIILIVIGIATILNRESLSAKKTLPKLIIAALLVNFSLVFVGMIVDVANIILMTFFEEGIGQQIVEAISRSGESIERMMLGYMSALLVSFAIPFTAPFAQIGFITAMTTVFLPQIIDSVMQIITAFFMGGTLLVYALLFLARIFIIQILAVVSPLAFVAWTMPSKKINLWRKWIKALIGWSFLGVVLMFFLLLSTLAVAPLKPDEPVSLLQGGYGDIGSIFVYYISLGVFLAVAVKLSKDFMPTGADAIIKGVELAKNGMRDVVAPMSKPLQRSVTDEATDEKIQKRQERLDQNDFDSLGNVAKGLNDFANLQIGKWARKGYRSGYKGPKSPEAKASDFEKRYKDMVKDSTVEELISISKNQNQSSRLRTMAIEKLAKDKDKKLENPETRKLVAQNWDRFSKEFKNDFAKMHPDIHVDLADDISQGVKDMLSKIDEYSGSDVKDISFTGKFASEKAAAVIRDPSKLQSLGSASYKKKEEFVDAVKEIGIYGPDETNHLRNMGIDGDDMMKKFKSYFENEKEAAKWPENLLGFLGDEDEDGGDDNNSQ